MNITAFGGDLCQYIETISGGAGAVSFFFFISVLIEFLRLCNRAAWTTRHLVTRDVATTRQSAGDLVRWVIQRWRNYLLQIAEEASIRKTYHSLDDRVQGRWNCGRCLMFAFSLQGPTWDGRSGVHVHMTNTRITDPEIIERRWVYWLRRD